VRAVKCLEDHGLCESGLLIEHLLNLLGEGTLELSAAFTGLFSLSAAFGDFPAAGLAVFLPGSVCGQEQGSADRADPWIGKALQLTKARVERRRRSGSDLILRVHRIDGFRRDHLAVGLFGKRRFRESIGEP
jgi:hypothetical protein